MDHMAKHIVFNSLIAGALKTLEAGTMRTFPHSLSLSSIQNVLLCVSEGVAQFTSCPVMAESFHRQLRSNNICSGKRVPTEEYGCAGHCGGHVASFLH